MFTDALIKLYEKDLNEIFQDISGSKGLVFDASLPPKFLSLSESFVASNSILFTTLLDIAIEPPEEQSIADHVFFVVRADPSTMLSVASHVRYLMGRSGANKQQEFHILFAPARTVICEQVLEDEGVLDILDVAEFQLGFVPVETDLISLEMDDFFRQVYVRNDTSPVQSLAIALQRLQSSFGIISNVKCKGEISRKVIQKVLELQGEETVQKDGGLSGAPLRLRNDIDSMVIVDRDVDLLSPFLTPLTYEGLIEEFIGIEDGVIKLDPNVVGEDEDEEDKEDGQKKTRKKRTDGRKPGEKVTITMTNEDVIFADIRNLSIEQLGVFLKEKAIRIKDSYTNFRGNKDASISEIHKFVKQIPNLAKEYESVNHHIHIAELLKRLSDTRDFRELWQTERGILEGEVYLDQLEDMIFADTNGEYATKVLRLLALQSIAAGGLRPAKYDQLKRMISQVYGFEYVFTLQIMEKMGLVKKKDAILSVVDTSSSVWHSIKKPMQLINENINLAKPDDISYVTSGYAPLSVRLVQVLSSSTTSRQFANEIKALSGPYIEFYQHERSNEELGNRISKLSNDSVFIHSNDTNNNSLPGELISTSSVSLDMATTKEELGKPVMLVVFVGGITIMEIAAFRFLSKDPSYPFSIVIATSKVISSTSVLNSIHNDKDFVSVSLDS